MALVTAAATAVMLSFHGCVHGAQEEVRMSPSTTIDEHRLEIDRVIFLWSETIFAILDDWAKWVQGDNKKPSERGDHPDKATFHSLKTGLEKYGHQLKMQLNVLRSRKIDDHDPDDESLRLNRKFAAYCEGLSLFMDLGWYCDKNNNVITMSAAGRDHLYHFTISGKKAHCACTSHKFWSQTFDNQEPEKGKPEKVVAQTPQKNACKPEVLYLEPNPNLIHEHDCSVQEPSHEPLKDDEKHKDYPKTPKNEESDGGCCVCCSILAGGIDEDMRQRIADRNRNYRYRVLDKARSGNDRRRLHNTSKQNKDSF